MNFRYLLFLLLLSCNQGPLEDMNQVVEIFRIVEIMPTLSNCDQDRRQARRDCVESELLEFISKNMEYPELARQFNYEDTVIIQFIVESDSTISNIKIPRNHKYKYGLGEEGLRLANLMKDELKWVSGKQSDKVVRVRLTWPIIFKL